jgi:hypothetical protein
MKARRRGVFIEGTFSIGQFKQTLPVPAGSNYEWGGRCQNLQDVCASMLLAIGLISKGCGIIGLDDENPSISY